MPSSWPISSDYAAAVQTPDVCCSDLDLKSARAVTSALGLPRSCGGTFGDVYQFQSSDKKGQWAVKCFTKSVAKLNERYGQISQELARLRLPFAVEFNYLPHGILVRGEWYPLLKMEWVEGLTLRQFVIQNLNKPKLLTVLLEIWLKVLPRLREAGIAHGDLQHGNVMLIPGSTEGALALRLIDYDGMWVPSMSGQPPTELGHPNYQHPQRARQNIFSPEIDRFPHLVIACALRCLARSGGERLWKDYDNQDNLLFTMQDFETPSKSKLLLELWNSGDRELQAWVGHLVTAAQSPLEAAPLLSTLVNAGRIRALSDEEEKFVRSILGPPTQRARTDLKSGTETDWWDSEDAESPTAESVTEPIVSVEQPTVARAVKKSVGRTELGDKHTKQNADMVRHDRTLRRKLDLDQEQEVEVAQSDAEFASWSIWTKSVLIGLAVIMVGVGIGWLTGGSDAPNSGVSSDAKMTPGTVASNSSERSPAPDWDAASFREIPEFTSSATKVDASCRFTFSPDGSLFAAAIKDSASVKIWAADTGREITTLKWHARQITFSPDGARIVMPSDNGLLGLFEVSSGRQVLMLRGNGVAPRVVFSPDGLQMASTGTDDGAVKIWNTVTGEETLSWKHGIGHARDLVFSPDGVKVVWWENDTLALYDISSGAMRSMLGRSNDLEHMAFSVNGERLAVANGKDRTVGIWETATGKQIATLNGYDHGALAFSPDRRQITSRSFSGNTLKVWDTTNFNETLMLKESSIYASPYLPVPFSPDGSKIASVADGSRAVKLWSADSGQEILDISGNRNLFVSSVAFSPDGKQLATGDWSGSLKLWDTTTGQELASQTHPKQVARVVFSPNGMRILSLSDEGSVKLWSSGRKTPYAVSSSIDRSPSTTNGKPATETTETSSSPKVEERLTVERSPLKTTKPIGVMAYSADGSTLALLERSSGLGTVVTVCDGTTNEKRGELLIKVSEGFTGIVAMSLSPNGKLLATGDVSTGRIGIWDLESKQCAAIVAPPVPPRSVIALTYSADGTAIAAGFSSGVYDGSIGVYDVQSRRWTQTIKHSSRVTCLGFSRDGKSLAGGDEKLTTTLWNVGTGEKTTEYIVPDSDKSSVRNRFDSLSSVKFSPDGESVVAHCDGWAKVWSIFTGQICKTCYCQSRDLRASVVATGIQSSGQILMAEVDSMSLKVREAESGLEIAAFPVTRLFGGAIFSSDAKSFVATTMVGYSDGSEASGETRMWGASKQSSDPQPKAAATDVQTVTQPPDLKPPAQWRKVWGFNVGAQNAFVFSRDDRVLLVGGSRLIHLLDANDGRELSRLDSGYAVRSDLLNGGRVASIVCAKNSEVYAAVGQAVVSIQWNATELAKPKKDTTKNSLAKAAITKKDFTTDGKASLTMLFAAAGQLDSTSISPDGNSLAAVGKTFGISLMAVGKPFLNVWDAKSKKPLTKYADAFEAGASDSLSSSSVCFSFDGQLLAVGNAGSVVLLNAKTGKKIRTINSNSMTVDSVCISPDGRLLAFGSGSSIVFVDTEAGSELDPFNAHDEPIRHLQFSPDSETLASAAEDGTVRLWDVRTRIQQRVFFAGRSKMRSPDMAFSSDGKKLAIRTSSGEIELWTSSREANTE